MNLVALAAAASLAHAWWGDANGTFPPPECSIGPIERAFGGHEWNVLSCTGHRALLVIAPENSPARGTAFLVIAEATDHRVEGHGGGDIKSRMDGIFAVSHLSDIEFDALITATRLPSGR